MSYKLLQLCAIFVYFLLDAKTHDFGISFKTNNTFSGNMPEMHNFPCQTLSLHCLCMCVCRSPLIFSLLLFLVSVIGPFLTNDVSEILAAMLANWLYAFVKDPKHLCHGVLFFELQE